MITQENNLILQSYFTIALIKELKSNKLLESDYFASMHFDSPWIKESLKQIDVDNQGSVLLSLYAMLVIPRQLISSKYKDEYSSINLFLENHTQNTHSTYAKDDPIDKFLRHIRNAVAHSRVSFQPEKFVTFSDKKNKHETFSTDLPLCHLGTFLNKLQGIHLKYIKDNQDAQN